ncbi:MULTISPECIES: AraC family transcriptional regulator [unclassified Caballeronia]|jgi:AraC-like DNA-binding protein|uniref:AraC family transcriptional regulator n=1 Tax=unclassified Caballeronia TaxID=2646786 RepID=UPI00202998D5|nr:MULTISPECIES: AraC family transcriptional regulator [unclassified Caballeronia]
MRHPDLEVVDVRHGESFKAWSHGYPYKTVRWHFHPEFELQLIVATHGKFFVGDHVGSFGPGNLVLMGENLPHNWVSEVPDGEFVERRNLVIQFGTDFVKRCMEAFPECRDAQPLLDNARRGILFDSQTSAVVAPLFEELLTARGIRRISLFLRILECLCDAKEQTLLASIAYEQNVASSKRFGHVLAHIGKNLASDLRESDLAGLAGQSVSAFSRAFHRHTGATFVQYVNRLRIEAACHMLLADEINITQICFQAGFNNVSNFNRQFRAAKGMTPSEFRALQRINARSREVNLNAPSEGSPEHVSPGHTAAGYASSVDRRMRSSPT